MQLKFIKENRLDHPQALALGWASLALDSHSATSWPLSPSSSLLICKTGTVTVLTSRINVRIKQNDVHTFLSMLPGMLKVFSKW